MFHKFRDDLSRGLQPARSSAQAEACASVCDDSCRIHETLYWIAGTRAKPMRPKQVEPMSRLKTIASLSVLIAFIALCGCRTGGDRSWATARSGRKPATIKRVACLYEQKPWLSLDAAGDRDPEGIRYRVFLDPGTGRGVLRDGTLHIEMYLLGRDADNHSTRTLASDWHYATAEFASIARPGALGEGYFLYLRWQSKDIAGRDIEIVTSFEDHDGRRVRSATKRFRVPKYSR